MSKVYYLYGLPLERLQENVFCPRMCGRPSGTGTYGEKTAVRRIPESLLAQVDALLSERKAEWDSIRDGVLNCTYCSPEINLATVQVVPRRSDDLTDSSQVVPHGVSASANDSEPAAAVAEIVSNFGKEMNKQDIANSNPGKEKYLQRFNKHKKRH